MKYLLVWSYHIPFLWTWPQIHWICGDQGIVIYWNKRKHVSNRKSSVININITILWLMKKWHTLTTRGTRERRELSKLSKTNKWQTGRGSFFLGPGNVGLFTNIIFIYSKSRMISCLFKISDSCLFPKVFNPIKQLLSKICR